MMESKIASAIRMKLEPVAVVDVVMKPLRDVDSARDDVRSVTFLANPDQLSALVVPANYDGEHNENVIMPFDAAIRCFIRSTSGLVPVGSGPPSGSSARNDSAGCRGRSSWCRRCRPATASN